MPEEMVGGVEDLERMLRQSQGQSPQQGLGAVVGGERDATSVNKVPEISQELVERFAEDTMSPEDKNALLQVLTSLILPSAFSQHVGGEDLIKKKQEEVTGDQFLAGGGKEAMRDKMLGLGFK